MLSKDRAAELRTRLGLKIYAKFKEISTDHKLNDLVQGVRIPIRARGLVNAEFRRAPVLTFMIKNDEELHTIARAIYRKDEADNPYFLCQLRGSRSLGQKRKEITYKTG